MADVVPFPCVRPRVDLVQEIASLPYDVFSLDEAKEEIALNPKSFLSIDMAEATFDTPIDPNDDAVFAKACALLDKAIADGFYINDDEAHYYLYRLTAPSGRSQTGVVACSSIDDYENGIIKKHEKTRAGKEVNRIRHVDTCSAHTGPIFLAYRSEGSIEKVMEKLATTEPLYDFVADDGVRNTIWRVDSPEDSAIIRNAFENTESLYIADGHHRAASAVKTGLLRREAAQVAAQQTDGGASSAARLESDHFLSVLFPSNQLNILDYNRVVSDLGGQSVDGFLGRIAERFIVSAPQSTACKPKRKYCFGMYLEDSWYELITKDEYISDDPVDGLDVSILQDNLLAPYLGIEDPRVDDRIDFVGGIRGLEELERRVKQGMAVAFTLFPTSIDELFTVADAGRLMPPKSTWFEPKLRSGIFIHQI